MRYFLKYDICRTIAVFILIAISCLQPVFGKPVSENEKLPVVIICSYNPSTAGMERILSDFERARDSSSFPHLTITESLYCKNLQECAYAKNRFLNILSKYSGGEKSLKKMHPAVSSIGIIGQEAFAALLSISDDYPNLFKGIPIAVANVSSNYITLPENGSSLEDWHPKIHSYQEIAKKDLNIRGTLYAYDLQGNFDLIRELFPETRNIAFVTDNSMGGILLYLTAASAFKHYENAMNLIQISSRYLNNESIKEKLLELPPYSAILIGTWRIDKNNNFNLPSSLQSILEHTNAPVFSTTSRIIGSESIGGIKPDYFNQGKTLFEDLKEGMADKEESNSGFFELRKNETIIDASKLAERGIKKSKIKEAHFINDFISNNSTVNSYNPVILFIIIAAIITAMLFLLFSFCIRNKRKISQYQLNQKLISDNINSGIILIKGTKVIFCNFDKSKVMQDFCNGTGISEGDDCFKIKDSDSPCKDCPIEKAAEKGVIIKRKYIKDNGQIFSVEYIPVKEEKDSFTGTVIRIDDITESEKREKELTETKLANESANAFKTRLFANLSHEIRTPLNAIIGFSDLLSETDDEKLRIEYEKIIDTNNRKLLSLVNNMVDISDLETNHMNIKIQNFNLHEIFDDLYDKYLPQFEANGLYLHKDIPDDHVQIVSDKEKIELLMDNLLSNALKFTVKGGATIGYKESVNHWKLYVTDTGTGIEEDIREKIFERFFKADNFSNGIGLGLSISKMIAEKLNGSIEVESKKGQGSQFTFLLPKTANGADNAS
ncbi:MAG: HAMP domain-containing histidine kinase [Bacteroidales bacterium]|jgi:nitrogen-specific signal transduction histidine kinase|nr:HAMP domain-containing histidine kinase [Bacteroidales bacterium]